MAVKSTQEGCDSYSDVLPEEVNTVAHSELPVAFPNSMEHYVPLKSQVSLNDQMSIQTYMKKTVENAAAYSECTEKLVDIEKGKSETPKTNEETVCYLNNEEGHMKLIGFEMGGILSKFSIRDGSMCYYWTDKTAGEKVLDAPRMRKYKRTTSFNSRKVALMFSVLSSLGTIILIYLTLRVKQISDASTHSE